MAQRVKPMLIGPDATFVCPKCGHGAVQDRMTNSIQWDDKVTCLNCRAVTVVRDLKVVFGFIRVVERSTDDYPADIVREWQRIADEEAGAPATPPMERA